MGVNNMNEHAESGRAALRLRVIGIALVVLLAIIAALLVHFRFGSGAAFAEEGADTAKPILTVSSGGDSASADTAEGTSLAIVSEDGATRFSTDGGETWQEGYPDGYSLTDDGEGGTLIGSVEGLSADGEKVYLGEDVTESLSVRSQNGVTSYSTDGGQTWSEDIPAGVSIGSESE
jgi:hypothetical protein